MLRHAIRCCVSAVLLALTALLLQAGPTGAEAGATGTLAVESRPPGAHVVLDGDVHVEGIAPFVVDRGFSGKYRVSARLAGHRVWERDVFLTGTGTDTLTVSMAPLTRTGAALRSLVIPGWGQRFLERKRESSLLFFGAAAIGAAAAYTQSRYASAMDDYEERRDAYAQAEESDEIRQAFSAMEDSYREVRDRRDGRNAILWTGAVVWAVGVIDALLNVPAAEPGALSHSSTARLAPSAAAEPGGTVSLALRYRF